MTTLKLRIEKFLKVSSVCDIRIEEGSEDQKHHLLNNSPSKLYLNFDVVRFTNNDSGKSVKLYKCREAGCEKLMMKWLSMQDHLRFHDGDKPYVCPALTCPKTFTQTSNMRKHLCQTHKISSLVCKVCKRSFRRHLTLLRHFLEHDVQDIKNLQEKEEGDEEI